jgi:hypothetical protein
MNDTFAALISEDLERGFASVESALKKAVSGFSCICPHMRGSQQANYCTENAVGGFNLMQCLLGFIYSAKPLDHDCQPFLGLVFQLHFLRAIHDLGPEPITHTHKRQNSVYSAHMP